MNLEIGAEIPLVFLRLLKEEDADEIVFVGQPMATKKAPALKAFIPGIVCVIPVGFCWLSDPLTAGDQTGFLSRLLAWFSHAAAAVASIAAIYFTCRALTIREPPKEFDLESEGEAAQIE